MTRVLVTGSSGYVASDLVPRLKDEINVFGVDQHFSNYSDLEASIESFEFKKCMDQFDEEEIIRVAELMKIDLEDHGEHVSRVKKMLEYFDILDQIDLSTEVISGRSIRLVNIPFFLGILKIIANFLYVLGFFGRIDLKLTPNRVVKLFSDTSYSHVDSMDIDTETYASRNCEELPEILAKFSRGEK